MVCGKIEVLSLDLKLIFKFQVYPTKEYSTKCT
jgi:hypothetical protein